MSKLEGKLGKKLKLLRQRNVGRLRVRDQRRDSILAGRPLRFADEASLLSRTIPAEWIQQAIMAGLPVTVENAVVKGPLDLKYETVTPIVSIIGSVIEDSVDLSYCTCSHKLDFRGTTFRGEVSFVSSTLEAEVSFFAATFERALDCRDVTVDGALNCRAASFADASFNRGVFKKSILFDGVTFGGMADFRYCSIDGNAFFTGGTFESKAHFAGAQISREVHFNPAQFKGEANFVGTVVGGSAYFDYEWDALIINVDDHSLANPGAHFEVACNLNSLKVGGAAFFDNAFFAEQVNLGSMVVGHQASFSGAVFEGIAGFEGTRIGGKATFQGARFQQVASFDRVTFSEGAHFHEAIFLNAYFPGTLFKKSVSFNGVSFGPEVRFDGEPTISDTNLREIPSAVRRLKLNERFGDGIDLRGCTYERMRVSSWRSIMDRLEPYERQPYVQLESTYRQAGEDRMADDVYYRRRSLEGRHKKGLRRWGDLTLWALVGYGVKPARLIVFVLAFLVLGTLVFQTPNAARPAQDSPISAARCEQRCELAWSEAFWMSVDTFLPLPGGLPSGAAWEASTNPVTLSTPIFRSQLPISFSSVASLMRLAGWVIVPVGIAGLTGVLQRSSSG